MSQQVELLSITVHTDSETGIEAVVELDYGICQGSAAYWRQKRKDALVAFLRDLATRLEAGVAPFANDAKEVERWKESMR